VKVTIAAQPRLPLWLKVLYTAFVVVLVPYYWRTYGPLNFLFFCDIALLIALPGIWLESPLLLGTQLLSIFIPQMVWVIDVASRLVTGTAIFGLTDYMFDSSVSLFVRGLSTFHGWLPFLLLYCVWRLGYDRRSFIVQSILGISVILVCYFFTPMPPAPPENPTLTVNLNYVFGFSATEPQNWVPGWAWVLAMIVAVPLLMYWPVHWVLRKLIRNPHDDVPAPAASDMNQHTRKSAT